MLCQLVTADIDVIDIVGIVDIIMGNDFSPGTDSFTSVQYSASNVG